jgi:DNA helicase IV
VVERSDTAGVLAAERDHLEFAGRCLAGMRESAERIADYGVDELASHSLGRIRAERLAALTADPDAPPFFGRIDRDAETPGVDTETFHIGRRHVRDPAGDPVVVDWRAPISTAFYRASADDPMGVHRRRRFGFQHGRLTSFEDEQLDRGQALGLSSALLRAEIERPRVGPMRDIVATIQPDQDVLVRADLDTSLCIQGAPGTGKTAVGLHRAAYLLYSYPDRLRRTGVLVVGPNAAFLHYIGQVLPSLGEVGIEQSTVDELVGTAPDVVDESTAAATLKGDERMAEVLRRALVSHVAKPGEDIVAVVGTRRYRIGAHHLRRYVDDARRSLSDGLRWSTARERLRSQIAEDVRRQREDVGGAPSDAETARVARSAAVREFVDAVWPALTPTSLLASLYADPDLLQRSSAGILDDPERALLTRARGGSRQARWSRADAVLLDELAGLIDGTATFVHVVVDEAQDLSAMQCRAVARRCPLGSVTVLGDLAQATTPWAPGDWVRTLANLGHPSAQIRALTAGYRVPAQVLDVANRLLPHIATAVPPATSVRSSAEDLRFAPAGAFVDELRRCLAAEGSVGVIVADRRAAEVHSVLAAHRIAAHGADDDDDDIRVSVVPATAAKGLEFDSVVLLEPGQIVAAEPTRSVGLRRLYVVLTRAVSRLVVLHDEPLPRELS